MTIPALDALPDVQPDPRAWRPEETALLRRYHAKGARALLPYLPGRSIDAIQSHARRQGLTCPLTPRPR